jgi:hypothetical protein
MELTPRPSHEPIVRLIESAYEFLSRAAGDIGADPKHSIINFATGIELMLKARLMKEHWVLVVERASEAVLKDFREGKLHTVAPKEAIKRLRNICGENIPDDAQKVFEGIADHRNRLIHFFHEVTRDGAPPALVEQVTLEQCLGWYHLEQLLLNWGKPFTNYRGDLYRINAQMRQNRAFLGTVYNRVKDDIATEISDGLEFADCNGCGFHATRVRTLTDAIEERLCRVCTLYEQFVQFKCPELSCEGEFTVRADHNSPRNCPECKHKLTRREIDEALDTEELDRKMSRPGRNCAFCGGYHTVVVHHDFYVCTDCLSAVDEIQTCSWCNDGQIGGGDLENSYHAGCEFCEGKGGYD